MAGKRRLGFMILGGVLVLSFGLFILVTLPYNSKIPDPPDSGNLSAPVREQIAEARARAHRFPSAQNLGRLGMVYHSSAQYEQAARCYQLAARRSPSEWIWNYYLGFLHMEMGESEEVIANFKSVLERNNEVHHAWYYLGEEYRNLRKNELAEDSFGKIVGIQTQSNAGNQAGRYDYFPLGTYASYQLARLYFDTDRLDLAERTLEGIIRDHRSFGPAYRLLSNIYSIRGDQPASRRYGVRANDLVVFSPPVDTLVDRLVLLSRSELYLLKKIDEAEKSIYPEWAMQLVSVAMQYMPDNPYLISKAIRNCLSSGLEEQAAAYTDRHLGFFRDNFTEMNNMGILFFQKRMYPQSVIYLNRALELKPMDPDIQNSLAICYWSMGNQQRAQELLDELVVAHWDHPDVLANVMNLRFDLGEDEKAMACLNRLRKISPEHPKVLKLEGALAEKDGNFRKAIALYETSFQQDPGDMSTIRSLGNLLLRQEMWDPYIGLLRSALEDHPNDPYLLERLGTILVTCPDPAHRNTREGRDYSERAFIHTDSRSMTLVSAGRSLALAYAELGDRQNAWSVINMTLNIAHGENISPSYQEELQSIARRIQTLDQG